MRVPRPAACAIAALSGADSARRASLRAYAQPQRARLRRRAGGWERTIHAKAMAAVGCVRLMPSGRNMHSSESGLAPSSTRVPERSPHQCCAFACLPARACAFANACLWMRQPGMRTSARTVRASASAGRCGSQERQRASRRRGEPGPGADVAAVSCAPLWPGSSGTVHTSGASGGNGVSPSTSAIACTPAGATISHLMGDQSPRRTRVAG